MMMIPVPAMLTDVEVPVLPGHGGPVLPLTRSRPVARHHELGEYSHGETSAHVSQLKPGRIAGKSGFDQTIMMVSEPLTSEKTWIIIKIFAFKFKISPLR